MVDTTIYSSKEDTPELAVRQILVKARVKEPLRRLVADKGLLDPDMWAAVSDNLDGFKSNIERLLTTQALGATEEEKEASLIALGSAWRKCSSMAMARDSRRTRLEEDPHQIPEMGTADVGQMRIAFTTNHPDAVITEHKEPHKRFVERMDRDFTVNELIPVYELGEVRLRSDNIVTTPGITKTTEHLLRATQIDVSASVTVEEDALNRIHAFYMALEYHGHCSMAYFKGDSNDMKSVSGGPLNFIKELEGRRRETPGLFFILYCDKKFRSKVHELISEQHDKYPSYAAAMYETFHHHKNIWSEGRTEALEDARAKAKTPAEPPRGVKRARSRSMSQDHQGNKGKVGTERSARNDRRAKAKAKQAAALLEKDPLPRGNRPPERRQAPAVEFAALSNVKRTPGACKFFNLSSGCALGDKCKMKHVCYECGANHTWYEHHYRR